MGPTFDLSTFHRILLVLLAVVLGNVGEVVVGGVAGRLLTAAAAIALAVSFGLAELAVSLWTGRWRINATNRLRRS